MNATAPKIWHLSYWSSTWASMPSSQKKIFGTIMMVHFALSLWFISLQGINLDEGGYFYYALQWAKGHPERLSNMMDSKTPMVAMSLMATLIKPWLSPSLLQNDQFFYVKAGRGFMYMYQLLGSYFMFCFLYRLWGGSKWIVPFLFFCFDPLVFSYGLFVSTDLPSASILIAVIYAAWRYASIKEAKYWWFLCVASAVGVLLKQSLVHIYPLLIILFCFDAFQKRQFKFSKAAVQVFQFLMVQWLLINLVYYGKGFGTAFGDMHFLSSVFNTAQQSFPMAKDLPIPLPTPFIQGFDWLLHNSEVGGCKPESSYQGVWIMGKESCTEPVWYYYLLTAAFKLPLLIWLAVFLLLARVFKKGRIRETLWAYKFVWMPFIYFFLILSLTNKFQIGIRHAILLLPFLYIGISGVFVRLYDGKRWLFICLVSLHVISIVRYWPNLMAYTNELLLNKTMVYKTIRDSSIDYGQADPLLRKFLKEHPDYAYPMSTPAAGKFAITVFTLTDAYTGVAWKDYGWLNNNFTPVDNYMFTILLFDVTEAQLQSKGLK